MYYFGEGVAQDYREAAKWFRLAVAADKGDALSEKFLGHIFYKGGAGVTQEAIKLRNLAAKKMTSAEVLEAQAMAKLCEESNYKKCDKIEGNQSGPVTSVTMMKTEAGTYVVPVFINNAITLDFLVDSGASDVSIPLDVVTTLMRTGTLKQSDFLDEKTYRLADGSTVPSQTFRIRSLKVGNKTIENVNGSVASVKGTLLLGQSFLSRFKSWSIDNNKHALVFE
jgi:clan AA aspartic protease (TIGR02281 family)